MLHHDKKEKEEEEQSSSKSYGAGDGSAVENMNCSLGRPARVCFPVPTLGSSHSHAYHM